MSNYIWDLDGTLINSYPAIVNKILEVLKDFDLTYSKDFIYESIIKESAGAFNKYISLKHNIPLDEVYKAYHSHKDDVDLISLMPHVVETLEKSIARGDKHFIFTNRGLSTFEIIDKLDIRKYFIEVVVITNGLAYKPAPDGVNYLVNKYNLDKNDTYYVGDRRLDIECANNAKIKSIFYNSSGIDITDIDITYKIKDLLEILGL